MWLKTAIAAFLQGVGLVCLCVSYRKFVNEYWPMTSTVIIHYMLWKYIIISVFSVQSLLFVILTQRNDEETAVMVWAFPSGFIWQTAIFYSLGIALEEIVKVTFDFVYHYNLQIPAIMMAVTLAIVVSYLSYLLRCRQRAVYGALEVAFGVLTILYSCFSLILIPVSGRVDQLAAVDFSQMAIQFFAGMYIVVRGLNNIEDGMKIGPLTVKTIRAKIALHREERQKKDRERVDRWRKSSGPWG